MLRVLTPSRVSKESLKQAFGAFSEANGLPTELGTWFFKKLYERWPNLHETRSRAEGAEGRYLAGIFLKPWRRE